MTGTQTRYRLRILRELIKLFKRTGWYAPVYKHVAFEIPATTVSFANDATARNSVFPEALISLPIYALNTIQLPRNTFSI